MTVLSLVLGANLNLNLCVSLVAPLRLFLYSRLHQFKQPEAEDLMLLIVRNNSVYQTQNGFDRQVLRIRQAAAGFKLRTNRANH